MISTKLLRKWTLSQENLMQFTDDRFWTIDGMFCNISHKTKYDLQ